MKKLLQIEWMKVKSYRTFWILMGLFVVAMTGSNYIAYMIDAEIKKNIPMGEAVIGSPLSYPQIWGTISWVSSLMLYLPGFIMILLISNEYTFKTHRQNIIDGWSRKQFVNVKLVIAFLLTLISTILVILSTLIFGVAAGSSFSIDGFVSIGYFFLCSWVYMLFALLLAFLFRKAVLAIGIYFIFGLIIDNVIPAWLRYALNGKPYATYFMPLDVADGLLKHPFSKQSSSFLDAPNIYICLAISCAWIVFYHWFTNRKFQGEDL